MKFRALLTGLLMLFVALSVVAIVLKETGKKPAQTGNTAPAATKAADTATPGNEAAQASQVIAYYFHTNVRCPSCVKIENQTKTAIEETFTEQLESGDLVFRMVNTDEEPNAHFVEDYQLVTKTVVLVEMHGGKRVRWDKLGRTWKLLGDSEQFHDYIVKGVQTYLDGKPYTEAEE